jgi:peptidoglycan/LPS O-acetylase OafA/YrhL
MKRIKGIDTLRFVMAVWVVFYHFTIVPLPSAFGSHGEPATLVRYLYNNFFCGPAAVIVFFVISGFCIHYPFRDATRLDLLSFYSRRQVRILIPVAVAIALAPAVNEPILDMNQSVLWSLVCEEVYYAIYPLLLVARQRWGWRRLVVVSFLAAIAVALTNPRALDYQRFGWLNWVLGLPCWLMGAALAERIDGAVASRQMPSTQAIWGWRAAVLGATWVCGLARHAGLGYAWTLNPFAIVATLWLEREIVRAERLPAGRLERAGAFSYSIYLVHGHAELFWLRFAHRLPEPVDSLFRNAFIFGAAYVFYLAVERPAHRLARRIHAGVMARYRPPRPASL